MTVFRAAALALLVLSVACRAESPPAQSGTQPGSARMSPAGLDVIPLEIRSASGVHRFSVEVARTPAEQAQGLMYRQELAPDAGMLFPFDPPRPASFWMKNTLIPLDMIFIRADGRIAAIAENTIPHSLDPVAVGEPVAAVLEIAGGRSAELGIRPGDRASW